MTEKDLNTEDDLTVGGEYEHKRSGCRYVYKVPLGFETPSLCCYDANRRLIHAYKATDKRVGKLSQVK